MADSIDITAGRQAVALAKQEWGPTALEPYLSALVSVPDRVCTVIGKWFAVSVEPRQHGLARAEIAERGLVPYLPMIPNRERHGRGAERTAYRPMFGPYMFVKCALTAENFGLVTSARGVKRFLGMDANPEPVDDARIEIIRLIEADMQSREDRRALIEQASKAAKEKGRSGIVWHFSEGDRVKIKHGPFATFYAQLESAVDEHDRIKALVSILGGPSRVVLSAFDLEAP